MLVVQDQQSEDVMLTSGKFRWVFFTKPVIHNLAVGTVQEVIG